MNAAKVRTIIWQLWEGVLEEVLKIGLSPPGNVTWPVGYSLGSEVILHFTRKLSWHRNCIAALSELVWDKKLEGETETDRRAESERQRKKETENETGTKKRVKERVTKRARQTETETETGRQRGRKLERERGQKHNTRYNKLSNRPLQLWQINLRDFAINANICVKSTIIWLA